MKAKIFVGERESGKTRTANMIAEYVGKEKTEIFFGRGLYNHPFVFSEIKEDTKLIIINDCPENFDYSRFFQVEDNGQNGGDLKFTITREIRGQKTQIIHVPYLIFTTNKLSKKWLEYGASFEGRFEIIQFPLSFSYEILHRTIFDISVNTPYSEKEIHEFMILTGLKIDDVKKVLNDFFIEKNITSLNDINKFIKAGYLKFN